MKKKYIFLFLLFISVNLFSDNLGTNINTKIFNLKNKVYNLLEINNKFVYYDKLSHLINVYNKTNGENKTLFAFDRILTKFSMDVDNKSNIYLCYLSPGVMKREIVLIKYDDSFNQIFKKTINVEDNLINNFVGIKISKSGEICFLFSIRKDFKDMILIKFYNKQLGFEKQLMLEGELKSNRHLAFDKNNNIVVYINYRKVNDFIFIYNSIGIPINNIKLKSSPTQIIIDSENNLNMIYSDYEFIKGTKKYKAIYHKYTLNGEPILGFEIIGNTYEQTPYFWKMGKNVSIYFTGDKKVYTYNDNEQTQKIEENDNNPLLTNPLINPMGF